MDKASGDPLNPSSPPVKVTETCKQCYGIAYMTAYMIANDLEPSCLGLKSTLKRGSQLEVLNPEARSEPIDTIVIGHSVANRHKNGAWSTPYLISGVAFQHQEPLTELVPAHCAKVVNFYVNSMSTLVKKFTAPDFPERWYRSTCKICRSCEKTGTKYVYDMKRVIDYIFRS